MYLFLLCMCIVYSYICLYLYASVHSAFVYNTMQCPPIQKLLTNPPDVSYDPRLSSFVGDFWSMSLLYLWQEQE